MPPCSWLLAYDTDLHDGQMADKTDALQKIAPSPYAGTPGGQSRLHKPPGKQLPVSGIDGVRKPVLASCSETVLSNQAACRITGGTDLQGNLGLR